jgi:hypothetical protein
MRMQIRLFTLMRIRIRLLTFKEGSRSLFSLADPNQDPNIQCDADADPDPNFHIDADSDPDPAPHKSNSNL